MTITTDTGNVVVIKIGRLDAPQPCAYCGALATAGFATFNTGNPGGHLTPVCVRCAEQNKDIQILEQVRQVYAGTIDTANIIKPMPLSLGECHQCGKSACNYVISESGGLLHTGFYLCDACMVRDLPATDLAFDAGTGTYVRHVSKDVA